MNPKPGYHTVQLFDQFCKPDSEGGDIDTIWTQVTNPGQSLPNTHKLIRAKEGRSDRFLIVSEVYPTATTALADLVLPSAMWVEKNGVVGNSERRTQSWERMVPAPGRGSDDALAAHRRCTATVRARPHRPPRQGRSLALRAARRGRRSELRIWEWDVWRTQNVDARLYEEYRPFTALKHKDVAPYDVLKRERGMRWPVVQGADGHYRETRWRFVEGHDSNVPQARAFSSTTPRRRMTGPRSGSGRGNRQQSVSTRSTR
jgi:nitrate reductase NapA